MAVRKSISKKVRFEVFKRDSFKCQFCGATSPDVLLVIDHLHPVSKGGDNDITNLVTSCEPCNAGKSDRELSDDSMLVKQREQLEVLSERREQLKLMMQWRKGLKSLQQDSINAVVAAFKENIKETFDINERGRKQVLKWLAKYKLNEVLDAIEVACASYVKTNNDGTINEESVNLAWQKVPGVAGLSQASDELRQLYYIRGIMRNRYSFVNEWRAIQLMKDACERGVESDEIKSLVLDTNNWTQFVSGLESLERAADQKEGGV